MLVWFVCRNGKTKSFLKLIVNTAIKYDLVDWSRWILKIIATDKMYKR